MMPKSYWIENLYVEDIQSFAKYQVANTEAATKYGANFLEANRQQTVEGQLYHPMQAFVESVVYEDAIDCQPSPNTRHKLT